MSETYRATLNGESNVTSECGHRILYGWDVVAVHYVRLNDPNHVYSISPDQLYGYASVAPIGAAPTVAILDYSLKPQRGFAWGARIRATATQAATDCHPNGWSASGEAASLYDDLVAPEGGGGDGTPVAAAIAPPPI